MIISTGLQECHVEGRSATVVGCIDSPCVTDTQPAGLCILFCKNTPDDGLPQFAGESVPVRKYQGVSVLLVTQIRIIFRRDEEGELWPRVEHILFEGKRHIPEQS